MISFRYHIVSIVAVFLALALGIVVGTTALSGPITRDLRKQVDSAKKQRDDLSGQVKNLQGQVDDAGQFASTYGSKLVSNTLTGKPVVEVVLPGVTSGVQSGVEKELTAAGATIGGKVTIDKNYLDSSQGSGILSLATGSSRPLSLPPLPTTSDPGVLGGALLAYVLTGKAQKNDVTAVLGSLSELHMLTLDGQSITPSPNVVVIAQGSPDSTYGGGMEHTLVTSIASATYGGKVVVAGDPKSVAGNGVVGSIRNDGSAKDTVSTVDDADTAFGQVSTALALAGTIKGDVGQYGTQDGAQALFPSPPS